MGASSKCFKLRSIRHMICVSCNELITIIGVCIPVSLTFYIVGVRLQMTCLGASYSFFTIKLRAQFKKKCTTQDLEMSMRHWR